jgi:4-phytase / acid phosphatase
MTDTLSISNSPAEDARTGQHVSGQHPGCHPVSQGKCKVILIGLLLTLALAVPVLAQTIKTDDDTTLKQIIIFGRHGIRSATVDTFALDQYSADPSPGFGEVPVGYLTRNGQKAARLLGSYFHDYLLQEGLLTGDASTDLSRSYFRANSIQRSNITASFFGTGLITGTTIATIPVHSHQIADPATGALQVPDPVIDPIQAGVVKIDADRAVTEVQGIYGSGEALQSAYSAELSLIRSVLYPPGTQPTPPTPPVPMPAPPGSYDPTSISFTLTANPSIKFAGSAINMGGLDSTTEAIDPFIMQYTDGFAPEDVAWGRLSLDALSQQTRLTALNINIEMRPPYISQVQSSNAASHVLRSMMQAVSGSNLRGAFGDHKSRVLVIISSDGYVAGLAGLLGLHWQLPGFQPDFIGPGGMLVFELRQSKASKDYLVRVFYTAQTFDQLRNLTPLILDVPPASMQLTVPGGSNSNGDSDVKWTTFKKLLTEVIGQQYVPPYGKEDPPPVIHNVPFFPLD